MYRQAAIRSAAVVRTARPFSTTPLVRKDATETIKDTAAQVNRTVSDKVLQGLEKTSESVTSNHGRADSFHS